MKGELLGDSLAIGGKNAFPFGMHQQLRDVIAEILSIGNLFPSGECMRLFVDSANQWLVDAPICTDLQLPPVKRA